MVKRDLDERLLEYGARIVKLVESLPKTLAGKTIGDQLLRSGMSVGANYEEAQAAESKNISFTNSKLRSKNYANQTTGCGYSQKRRRSQPTG